MNGQTHYGLSIINGNTYDQGYFEAELGFSRCSNPFAFGTDNWRTWRWGWISYYRCK